MHPQSCFVKIQNSFSKSRANYIETNSLHHTQKHITKDIPEEYKAYTDEYEIYRINVLPNYELLNNLLYLGADIIVLKPESLREEIKAVFEKGYNNYK